MKSKLTKTFHKNLDRRSGFKFPCQPKRRPNNRGPRGARNGPEPSRSEVRGHSPWINNEKRVAGATSPDAAYPHSPTLISVKMAAMLTSRVTFRVPTKARVVSTRAARAAVVRVSADADGFKSMNVTKPNIVNNLDGETTRNIDGKVYTITVKGDDVTVKDKFGQVYPSRVNKAAIVEADLTNSVAGANTMTIAGMNLALTPDQVTGFQERTELINGRAAMVGFIAAMGPELTGHSVASQVFSPAGFLSALFIGAATVAASCAPVALNKVTIDECFPTEGASYPDGLLPTFWTPAAEKVNGRVAMIAFTFMLAFGQ